MSAELCEATRRKIENTIRGLTVDAVEAAGIGHLGAPLGLARPVFQLWDQHLRFDPGEPGWPLRDRFVLSAGHASMLLYALLHLFGYGLALDEIENFRQLGSRTPGHPEFGETPGVEVTTGPLGQGFGNAVGMALAGQAVRARFPGGGGPGGHWIYAVASDGDLMEGVCYESASLAGHLGLGNLIVLYDDNRITIDGPTAQCFGEDVPKRFAAQGWHVQCADGEDVPELDAALRAARDEAARPSLIALRTEIGRTSPWAGQARAHGGPLGEELAAQTRRNLELPESRRFFVAEEVREYLAERIRAKAAERAERDARLADWQRAQPESAQGWQAACARSVPGDFAAQLCDAATGSDATRKHSGAVLQRIAAAAPGLLIGGSADLAGSNNTTLSDSGFIAAGDFAGANIHFGVREHAMAAITNGMALDGSLLPFAGTFMVFSDYMRPALRLAALMKLRAAFVFTHDSIFVGEDGPTHQPVEHLDALRAIPGLAVFRPADGVETAMAWAFIVQRAEGPVALSLTRQKVPAFERKAPFAPEDVWRGGYLLRDTSARADVVLLASGSETPLCCRAAEALGESGVAARVVSVPCLELLEAQEPGYLESLLPPGVPAVAVEAARGESFRRLVGREGLIYGMKGFGASAPWTDLAAHFGFTPEALTQAVLEHLGR